jgi:SAM-dependent methyltransferase
LVSKSEVRLLRSLRGIGRTALPAGSIWRRGCSSEVEYWANYLRTKGAEFPDGYRERLNRDGAIADRLILDAIDRTPSGPVRILDVGAGPLTVIGKRDPRNPARGIEIVATDPLAREYDKLLLEFGINPPVRTVPCRGEELVRTFGSSAFDIGHARNSIDHSADPIGIIENMVEVVRPGGTIILRHYHREGELTNYGHLHQWNFDLEDDHLLIWGKRERYDVTKHLAETATLTAQILPGAYHADWVEALIRPRARERHH